MVLLTAELAIADIVGLTAVAADSLGAGRVRRRVSRRVVRTFGANR